MNPIVKWVGGKRQLLQDIKLYIPYDFDTYYEPFFGGGAVFFEFLPEKAKINDLNSELINVYKQVKNHQRELIRLLEMHKQNHCKDYYYDIRNLDRNVEKYSKMSDVEKAARFIYLNKTCFNGLYRVNSKGQFNAPMGTYSNPNICDKQLIIEMSRYLKSHKVIMKNMDFEKFLKTTKHGDFVYLDPPYAPLSQTANFTSYNKDGFSVDEQIRLKKVCDQLHQKGVKFLLSNSDTPFINELYKKYKIVKVQAKRNINSKGNSRGKISEVLVMNYEDVISNDN